ncbi:hypothetical protein ACFVS2_20525 [Brevibacillus sp. NPDC058079]|uniref:hypothetical protein n=1 Tax=Brevibacillus sp. NPDC058079 TaxID=3346330 RepID=UPI0036EBA24B
MVTIHKLLKWCSFGLEVLLAIPILGGIIILSNGWTPLLVAGILHAVVIVFSLANKQYSVTGNIVGIIGSILGFIPFVGWFFHAVSTIILFFESIYVSRKNTNADL